MKLIKNPQIDCWKQFNNGIIDNQEKSIVMDSYPKYKPYISYGKRFRLCDILKVKEIILEIYNV